MKLVNTTVTIILVLSAARIHQCTYIANFFTPDSVRSGDTYYLACSYVITANFQINSISMLKYDSLFYRHSYLTGTNETHSVAGISIDQIQTIHSNVGVVLIRGATGDSEGNYTCALNSANGGSNDHAVQRYISFSNSGSKSFACLALVCMTIFVTIISGNKKAM